MFEAFRSDVDEGADYEPSGVALEYQGKPRWKWGNISFGLGLRITADDGESLWFGGGLYAEAPLGGRWVTEAILMPGYYDPGSSDFDIGGNLQFQSLLGIGYQISDKNRVSLAVTHLSNAGTADRNPGRNALALRLRRSF